MPGFFLTNSIQLSQFSALVKMFRKRDQNNQNTVQGELHMLKSVHEPMAIF